MPGEDHEEDEVCKCGVCGEIVWKWLLPSHLQQHQHPSPHPHRLHGMATSTSGPNQLKMFSCATCSYKTNLKGDLVKHQRIHTGEKPFTCSFCTYSCAQKSSLVVHLRTHTGERPYKCHQCDYSSTTPANLRSHILHRHNAL